MNEAYEAGIEVALEEIMAQFGEEFAEKVAARHFGFGKKSLGQRVSGAKAWAGKKYETAKKHVVAHRGKYSAGAGVAAGVGGKAAYDRYSK